MISAKMSSLARQVLATVSALTMSFVAMPAGLEFSDDFDYGIQNWTYRSDGISQMSFVQTEGFPELGSLQLRTDVGLADYLLSEAVSACFPASGNESFVLFAYVYKMSRNPSERCTLNVVFYPEDDCTGERSLASIPAPISEKTWTQLRRFSQTFINTRSIEVALQSIAAPVPTGETLCRFDNVRLFRDATVISIPSLNASGVVGLILGLSGFALVVFARFPATR